MFISLIKKHWKLILDALIVVAAILFVFLWNPLGIFGGGLKYHNTASHVSSIKNIGQLVTAEYYGEVIATIDQSRLKLIYEDDLNSNADYVFKQVKSYLYNELIAEEPEESNLENEEEISNWKLWRKKRKAKKLVKEDLKEEKVDGFIKKLDSFGIENTQITKDVLDYYARVVHGKSLSNKLNKEFSDKDKKKILVYLTEQLISREVELNASEFLKYMESGLPLRDNVTFSDFYYGKINEALTRKEVKKKLSMIGRGWVKAGFDFQQLDESNFWFDDEAGEVHLYGIYPKILNSDINPWFIPEKRIPGFQIIEANNKVDFKDAVLVKMYCVEKLRKMARDADILKQAEIQGEEAIKGFIGLVTGKEVNKVVFHYDAFSTFVSEIAKDNFINYQEAVQFDSMVIHEKFLIDSLYNADNHYSANQKLVEVKINMLKGQIKKLKKLKFTHEAIPFNRLSTLVYRVTSDSVLTFDELKELKGVRKSVNSDSLYNPIFAKNLWKVWYSDSLDFINEYNEAIDNIKRKTKLYGPKVFVEANRISNKIEISQKSIKPEIEISKSDSIEIGEIVMQEGQGESEMYLFDIAKSDSMLKLSIIIPNLSLENKLAKLRYPYTINSNWIRLIEEERAVKYEEENKRIEISNLQFLSQFKRYNQIISTELSFKREFNNTAANKTVTFTSFNATDSIITSDTITSLFVRINRKSGIGDLVICKSDNQIIKMNVFDNSTSSDIFMLYTHLPADSSKKLLDHFSTGSQMLPKWMADNLINMYIPDSALLKKVFANKIKYNSLLMTNYVSNTFHNSQLSTIQDTIQNDSVVITTIDGFGLTTSFSFSKEESDLLKYFVRYNNENTSNGVVRFGKKIRAYLRSDDSKQKLAKARHDLAERIK